MKFSIGQMVCRYVQTGDIMSPYKLIVGHIKERTSTGVIIQWYNAYDLKEDRYLAGSSYDGPRAKAFLHANIDEAWNHKDQADVREFGIEVPTREKKPR